MKDETMQPGRLDHMTKGWFVGNFTPTMHATDAAEVAVKKYAAGDHEEWHYHKIATETTLILQGSVEMNGCLYSDGDIVVMNPGEGTDFRAISDVTTVVVKVPCVSGDKYVRNDPSQ